jgi:hypothetical protein
MKGRIIGIIALTLLAFSIPARAQILEGVQARTGTFSTQGGSYYNFSGGSGCDLKVGVWGFVRNPGRYNIPCETNILELMSYCGGPQPGAYLDRVKIVRKGGPDKENELKEVFEVDLSKYLQVTDKSISSPELLLWPGDLVVVPGEETTPVDAILRISQVVVAITSIITATIAIINTSK